MWTKVTAKFEFEDGSEYTTGTVIDESKEGHVMLKMSSLWLSAVRWKERQFSKGGANPGDNQGEGVNS